MKIIHYGTDKFEPKKFQPITNNNWVKSLGGMWFSPIDSKDGWRDWCIGEEFSRFDESKFLVAELLPDTRIFVIDSVEDLLKAPLYTPSLCSTLYGQVIDFEQLSKDYDCIHLTADGQARTRFGRPNLYGWDCETVFVMNHKCINFDVHIIA